MSKFAKEHHPFDKSLGHNTNILLIVILCISSLIVICRNCTYLLQLKSMQLWQKLTHCLVSFHRRVNCFIKLVIMASEKCPPFSEYIHAVIWQLNSIRQVEDKYCTSKLQQAVAVNTGVNCSWYYYIAAIVRAIWLVTGRSGFSYLGPLSWQRITMLDRRGGVYENVNKAQFNCQLNAQYRKQNKGRTQLRRILLSW